MISSPGLLLGAPAPRVELRPSGITSSLGLDAAELAVKAGVPVEDWQIDGLELMHARTEDDRWACREYVEVLGRQQGKTAGLGLPRVLSGLFLVGERLIMWSAHKYDTALEAFLALQQALRTLGEEAGQDLIAVPHPILGHVLVRVINTNGKEGFTLSTGQRVQFVARHKGAGRGKSGDCNVIDEALFYTKVQQAALKPTELARPDPQTIYLTSPPIDGLSGEVLYRQQKRAKAGAQRLGYRDWGIPELLDDIAKMPPDRRAAFLDDLSRWASCLPALGRGRVTIRGVQDLRDALDDLDFAREVLGAWWKPVDTSHGWTVITKDAWTARGGADETERPTGPPCLAVAAAYPDAERVAIAVVGARPGHPDEDLGLVLRYDEGNSWTAGALADYVAKVRPCAVVLDKKGPGARLVKPIEDADVDLEHPTVDDAARAAGEFYTAVVGDQDGAGADFRHASQEVVATALSVAGKHTIGDGWRWPRGPHSAPLEALTWARWGWRTYGRRTPPPAPVGVPAQVGAGPATGDLMDIGF